MLKSKINMEHVYREEGLRQPETRRGGGLNGTKNSFDLWVLNNLSLETNAILEGTARMFVIYK